MSNPYLNRLETRGKSSHGKASEKKLAKSLSARLTPASGATDSSKGDMRAGDFLIESKSTIHASISLERDFFLKIAHEAQFAGKVPALSVSFVTGDGSPKKNGEWVCIPMHLFKELTES
jgi:hypothetical protein